MTTLEQYVHESLLNNVSLEKHTASEVSVVDVAQKFDWSIAQSRKAMYEYYSLQGNKMGDKLTFNMMCVYAEKDEERNELREGQHSHIKHFKLIKSPTDQQFVLEQVAPENIIDMFVYSIGLKHHGTGEGEDNLCVASLKPVQKVFVTHGKKLDLDENALEQDKTNVNDKIKSTTNFTKRSATEPAKGLEKRKMTSVADIRASSVATTPTATANNPSGTDSSSTSNNNSSSTSNNNSSSTSRTNTSSKSQKKASSFMGLRSMDFLAKRKEQDELKEQQRLQELREKRGVNTTTSTKTKPTASHNTNNAAKKPKIDLEKQKKLKELESMFSDSDDNEVETMPAENTKTQTDLAEVENLFDTTNDDSEMAELLTKGKQQQKEEEPPVKRSSPLKKTPDTYVDEEGYIVSTNLNANKRPAKRSASTLPLVSSAKTAGFETANKKRKQGNLMSFFSKRK